MEVENGKKFVASKNFVKVDFNSSSHFSVDQGQTIIGWAKRPKLHKLTIKQKKFLIGKLNRQLYFAWKHPAGANRPQRARRI